MNWVIDVNIYFKMRRFDWSRVFGPKYNISHDKLSLNIGDIFQMVFMHNVIIFRTVLLHFFLTSWRFNISLLLQVISSDFLKTFSIKWIQQWVLKMEIRVQEKEVNK